MGKYEDYNLQGYRKRVITSIVSCPECDSKNVYGDFHTKIPSNPKEDFMMIHCYECGLLATRGVGSGTLGRFPIVRGKCGHGISPEGDEYDTGSSHCQVCNETVEIASIEVVD